MATIQKGMMFVLSSPSGAGKTTLTRKIAEHNTNFSISISHTTRKPRPNEINGKDYHFVNSEEFEDLIKKNNFFEHANIFNNCYGTLKNPVLKLLSQNKSVLFDIDWQGTKQLKEIKNLSIVTFFILPPNLKILKERLLKRHNGQEKLVNERITKFNEELSHWNEYDFVFVNDDLEVCFKSMIKIIDGAKKGIKIVQDLSEVKKKIEELSK